MSWRVKAQADFRENDEVHRSQLQRFFASVVESGAIVMVAVSKGGAMRLASIAFSRLAKLWRDRSRRDPNATSVAALPILRHPFCATSHGCWCSLPPPH